MIGELDKTVFHSKNDTRLREEIISEYMPYIRSVAKKTFGRYLEYGRDDELSIALMAFNEAIDSYSPEKGHFLPFSAWVIKRRLIDYIRKNRNTNLDVPLETDVSDEDDPHITNLDNLAIHEYKESIITEFRRYEINEFKELLSNYGISLADMYVTSPKHTQTKLLITSVIKFILEQDDMITEIRHKGTLPLKILQEETGVPRKTLEHSRKYIIGTVLLRTSDFGYLNGFIRWE